MHNRKTDNCRVTGFRMFVEMVVDVLLITVCLTAIAATIVRLADVFRTHISRISEIRHAGERLSDDLKRKGDALDKIESQIAATREALGRIKTELKQSIHILEELENSNREVVYLFSEPRQTNVPVFISNIRCLQQDRMGWPAYYKESWVQPRQYMIWSNSDNDALRLLTQKFPPPYFHVGGVERLDPTHGLAKSTGVLN